MINNALTMTFRIDNGKPVGTIISHGSRIPKTEVVG
jgi:hypothetical protein